jgi:uncharacterized protein YcbK (DUF882 family)
MRPSNLSRRAALLVCAGAPLVAFGSRAQAALLRPRVLSFQNLHTGDRLTASYWADGRYIAEARAKIDWIFRDHRSGETAPISEALLDLLSRLRERLAIDEPFQIISGYRSPATNKALATHSGGVATNSRHMLGQAVDIRVSSVPLKRLRDEALALRIGGVGYYPKSDFVHVDVGPPRSW